MRFGLRSQLLVAVALPVVLTAAAVLSLRGVLEDREREASWVLHSLEVVGHAHALNAAALETQSAVRGWALFHEPRSLEAYGRSTAQFTTQHATLVTRVRDNDEQEERLSRIAARFRRWRVNFADEVAYGPPRPATVIEADFLENEPDFTAVADELNAFIEAERVLLDQRESVAASATSRANNAATFGLIVAALLALAGPLTIALRIIRRAGVLVRGAEGIARGVLDQRLPEGPDELGLVAAAFNRMSALLAAQRDRMLSLGRLRDALQGSHGLAEGASVLERLGPRIAQVQSAALYLQNASRNLLVRRAAFGAAGHVDAMGPDECWALRGGRVHWVLDPAADLICSHLRPEDAPALCVPLHADGQTLGLLTQRLRPPDVATAQQRDELERLSVELAELVGLTFANLRLREALSDQAIRDPLTGLCNRRYLDEALPRELLRAERRSAPLSVLVLDVDHFKRFNDTYGHQAGDALLRELGAVMRATFRGSDIACRFGGEEFLAVLPDCTAEDAVVRAEALRVRVGQISIAVAGQTVGAISVSIGVAVHPRNGLTGESLIAAADAALYRAKHEGRDRVILAPGPGRNDEARGLSGT